MTYLPHILDQLARHGLRPQPETTPGRLREALRELYKYEIRRLKGELLANRFARRDYAGRVLELRQRYWLLSVPTELWTAPGEGTGPDAEDSGGRGGFEEN